MYDFIIIGGGSAGCVLANRLSRDPGHRVLLLEAGPSDDTPLERAPMGMEKLYESEVFNWLFWSQNEKSQNGRKVYCPQGKVLGGGRRSAAGAWGGRFTCNRRLHHAHHCQRQHQCAGDGDWRQRR